MSIEISRQPSEVVQTADELARLTTDELRAELSRGLQITANTLTRLAAIVAELERRGEDLSHLRFALIGHLRRIAAGQVIPELVVRFQGTPRLLQRLVLLPITDQKRLASGELVQLAVRGQGGTVTHRMVDPMTLNGEQMRQVFADDHIRDYAEQAPIVEAKQPIAIEGPPAKRPTRAANIRADQKRGGLVIGRTFVTKADVLDALLALAGPDSESEHRTRPVNSALTPDEHAALRASAAEADISLNEIIHRALRAAGVI